jgi:hypothetical protein
VKSFSLTEAQYDRVKAERPDLVATQGEAAVIGFPLRDFLEVHYAFPEIEMFVDRFGEMFDRVVGASSKAEAPRGLVIAFRDRPNRMTADTVFWASALEQGEQWVEMNLTPVPEQPEPQNDIGDGYEMADAGPQNDQALAAVEAATTGLPELTPSGVASLRDNSKLLRLVRMKAGGEAAGLVSLRTEPGGWGVIDLALLTEAASGLRKPLLEWSIAWLRNNGGRRIRRRAGVDDVAELALLRELGFTAGEAGLYLTRVVDKAEAAAKIAERQSHGTIIKFGDWR